MTAIEEEIRHHEAELARLRAQRARWPEEPPIGTVLQFDREYGSKTYTYVAYHAPNDLWYVTGEYGAHSWASALEIIGDADAWTLEPTPVHSACVADSDEPDRSKTYRDATGVLWRFYAGHWRYRYELPEGGYRYSAGSHAFTWHKLTWLWNTGRDDVAGFPWVLADGQA